MQCYVTNATQSSNFAPMVKIKAPHMNDEISIFL